MRRWLRAALASWSSSVVGGSSGRASASWSAAGGLSPVVCRLTAGSRSRSAFRLLHGKISNTSTLNTCIYPHRPHSPRLASWMHSILNSQATLTKANQYMAEQLTSASMILTKLDLYLIPWRSSGALKPICKKLAFKFHLCILLKRKSVLMYRAKAGHVHSGVSVSVMYVLAFECVLLLVSSNKLYHVCRLNFCSARMMHVIYSTFCVPCLFISKCIPYLMWSDVYV